MTARSPYDGPANDEVVEDYVFIYTFYQGEYRFVRVRFDRAICGDCDATYDPETWIWDTDSNGDPMLVCACGGQLYSTCEGSD